VVEDTQLAQVLAVLAAAGREVRERMQQLLVLRIQAAVVGVVDILARQVVMAVQAAPVSSS
jgi:hypothetical protein